MPPQPGGIGAPLPVDRRDLTGAIDELAVVLVGHRKGVDVEGGDFYQVGRTFVVR